MLPINTSCGIVRAPMKYLPREVIQHLKEAETKVLNKALETRKLENQASPSASHQLRQFDKQPPIHETLKDRMPELAQELLGNPSSSTGIQWRFGRKGSIAVMVNGSQKGLYSNFETGTHGGPLKLIEETLNVSKESALEWAKDWLGHSHERITVQRQGAKEVKETTWTPILPVPAHVDRPDPKGNHYLSYMLKDKEIKDVYSYRNQEGQILGYVVRLEDKDGSKITPTLTYCQNEQGQQHWRWKGFEGKRPLYGLDRLDKDKPVLIVEGEKAADAAQKMLPGHAVLSWPGGAGAVSKADWSPLVGKDVTIWPDNDAPGFKAAEKITDTIKQLNQMNGFQSQVKTVDLPKDLPEKWDLADKFPENLSLDKVRGLIKQPDSLGLVKKNVHSLPQTDTATGKIQKIIEANPEYNIAINSEIVARIHDTFEGIKEKVVESPIKMTDREEFHLLKQCVHAMLDSLKSRELFHNEAHPLKARFNAEKTAWIQAIKMEKTDSFKIMIPQMSMERTTSLYENWDRTVAKSAANLENTHPKMDQSIKLTLAEETIRLMNLLPNHKPYIKVLMREKISQIQTNELDLIEGAKALLVSSRGEQKDTLELAKTAILKEFIATPDKNNSLNVPSLVEKINLETRQEQQRIAAIEGRILQQQQQRQLDNQRTL